MRKFSKKQYLAAGAAAAVIIAGGGAAYAYWTSTGSGNGSGTAGTASEFTVDVHVADLSNLAPGGPTDTVGFTVTNPGTGYQNISGATATVTGTDKSGCDASDFAITNVTLATGELAPTDSRDGSFDIQMIDKTASQDACQGATVSYTVSVS